MTAGTLAHLFLLKEDGAKDADDTFRKVARHLLLALDEQTRMHRLELQPAPDDHRRALNGNAWKGRALPEGLQLCRYIATLLASEGLPRFVLFHYDGDRPWSEHKESENTHKFAELIRLRVRTLLLSPSPSTVRPAPRSRGPVPPPLTPRSEEQVALLLGRLVEVVPFYSMESWLFRDVARLIRHCEEHCGQHLELLASWKSNPSALDEIRRPKDSLACCRDSLNNELAGPGFKRDDLYLVETSFYATVERLRLAQGLVEVLRKTADG